MHHPSLKTHRSPVSINTLRKESLGIRMTQSFGWARVWPAIKTLKAPSLRRGAWYPITNANTSNVVLGIGDQRVTVPRRIVEIRTKRPTKFSVIHRQEKVRARVATLDKRAVYAVCPNSKCRLPVFGHPSQIECPSCGHQGVIAWWETA